MRLKGLVLAAGEGSRLRPFTYSRPKHLIPLLGKPLIQYPIEDLVVAGVRDVGVVIRKGSPWFGKHVGVVLESGYALWIPPGFAHGFQALEDTLFLYLVTKEYSPQHERCIKWDDPELGIEWPLKENIIVNEKDRKCPSLKDAEYNFEY
ncbi:dTDP-4-dehydrorhamnose 3,5-epimerase family protein [Ignisphaera sp. 4213-co]|uniref:dTDP-4-dehydrorhamnose 3,5-epimerase family protein n=1 Tax=Ignisphaera cupida TaxID=3050454 RepID=A0ABD4Z431_9CREN|nr:dTDP-4-dehydrorhamnose 3,5-epimerase family protein [Ignisphaera sp. 4213-co]MDK6027905.1 dTDP-4-dehydrorhamnose 3,5-epimerase family protein [Ignisphaera sp. 4213-co]